MKLALVTDLHANREAVTAVLAHAQQQGAERHAFLGDFVGYGADPCWVLDTVAAYVERGAIAVMGNHDAAVAAGGSSTMTANAQRAIGWTRSQMTADHLRFIATLPMSAHDGECLFVHANAYAPAEWGYVQGRMEAVRSLQATDYRYTFCGHVHEQRLFNLSGTGKVGDFTPVPGVPIALSVQRRWLAIAGSAGQPRDGNPAACYAMFDIASATLTFHRVPYDHEAAAEKVRLAGLPQSHFASLDVDVR
jgi:diadenosine tetraphosphatase ApaH/serine/threonine PP2A family protein phosphatase